MSASDSSTTPIPGLSLVGAIALSSTYLAHQPWLKELKISPLIVGILMGVIVGNTVKHRLPTSIDAGVKLSASKILRLAIILYGFRITFDQIANIGVAGVALDVVMVSSTLLIGAFVGIRLLKMDRETALMTSAGAAICGAAAVIATEPVV